MRSLKKNQDTYIACRYKKTEDVVDLQGYKTGEKVVRYYPPMTFKANISGAKGNVLLKCLELILTMTRLYLCQSHTSNN